VLLALLAAGAVVAAVLVVGGTPAATTTERTVTVRNGVVQSVVSGSGNLGPSKQAELSFGASGKVTHVYVKPGEHVTSGQVLARIDRTTASVALAEANAQLADAQDQLEQAESSASTSTTTASASAASTTQAPSASGSGGGGSQSSGTSVPSAEAAVASAQLAVRQAQDALAATDLRAPMAGTVASVSGAVGDDVTSGTGSSTSSSSSSGFVTLVRLRRLTMQVSLSESDIGKVKVGQRATVTVNAVSGEQVGAHVTAIGVLSSSSSGSTSSTDSTSSTSSAVSYPVTVVLDQSASGIKAGMSATADIVTVQASGLVVPSAALQGSTVTLDNGGKRTTQRVQTGVVGDSSTQVVSGLKAGDVVVVRSTSAAAGRSATGSTASQPGGTGLSRRLGGGFGGAGGFRAGGAGGPP